MRTNAMGSSRHTHRDGTPATVNAGTTLNAHDLIFGLAAKDDDTVMRFQALDLETQVIVANAALVWMRRMPDGTADERDLKLRTTLAVHRAIRVIKPRPAPLTSLRTALAPLCRELRRRESAVHTIRAVHHALRHHVQPVTDEEARRYRGPVGVLRISA